MEDRIDVGERLVTIEGLGNRETRQDVFNQLSAYAITPQSSISLKAEAQRRRCACGQITPS
jgi:hypothetical protein